MALLAGPAAAVEAHVRVGLDGFLVAGAWTPLEVRCTVAPDEPPLDGAVLCDLPGDAVGRVRADVRAAPGTTSVVRLAVPVGAGRTYGVRVVDGAGRTVASTEPLATWTLVEPDDGLALVVGGRRLPGFGADEALPRLARVGPERLPRASGVLEGLRAIFLCGDAGGLREVARDPEAVTALRRFAEAGGTLVVAPGGPTAFWTGTPLAALLPVGDAAGWTSRPPEDVARVVGGLDPAGGPIPVLSTVLRRGARGEEDRRGRDPLVARRALGRGRVVFVAFDLEHPRVRRAPGLRNVLAELARRAPPWPRLPPRELEREAAAAFAAYPALGPGGFYLLVLAVLVHIGAIGPVASLVGKRRGARAGLLLAPAASFGVAAGVLAVATLARGEAEARLVTWSFHAAGSRQAAVQVDVGLFAGAGGAFTVEVPPGLRPTARSRDDLALLLPRAPVPAAEIAGGRVVAVGPVAVPARGHARVELAGAAGTDGGGRFLGPPLRVTASGPPDAWPTLRVVTDGAGPLAGLYGLAIHDHGPPFARLDRLPEVSPGVTVEWDASEGAPLEASGADPLDPFDGGRRAVDALVHAVGWRLLQERQRAVAGAPRAAARFPTAWVIRVVEEAADRGANGLTVRDGEGRPVATRVLRVALWPAEDGP